MADGNFAGKAPPPLSAIICTHARPGYLAACLDGLARQRGPRIEVVVVDSASPAPAAAEIRSWRRASMGSPGPYRLRPH